MGRCVTNRNIKMNKVSHHPAQVHTVNASYSSSETQCFILSHHCCNLISVGPPTQLWKSNTSIIGVEFVEKFTNALDAHASCFGDIIKAPGTSEDTEGGQDLEF